MESQCDLTAFGLPYPMTCPVCKLGPCHKPPRRHRIDDLRLRWEHYDRALRGDKRVPFDASRESVLAAYEDWVDAYLAARKDKGGEG